MKGKQKWADHLTEKAKHDNYPARSVYKLMEIQSKFSIIKKGFRVLDLGCAPGSWLLYAAQIVGAQGVTVGIDIEKVVVPLPSNATAIQGNIFNINEAVHINGENIHINNSLNITHSFIAKVQKEYDVLLSDMAPSTTGRKEVDAARSFELCEVALNIACKLLIQGGNFVCKIFQGSDFKMFEQNVKSNFKQHVVFKPESCRKASKEIYIIGRGKI